MAKFAFIYEEEDHGTFQDSEIQDGCAFVLTKGSRRGQLCGKSAAFSQMLDCFIPACSNHSCNYEYYIRLILEEARQLDQRTSNSLSINSIPKAIERSTECVVCMETIDPLLLPCGHTTCFTCVGRLEKKTCPMCRMEFKNEQLRRL